MANNINHKGVAKYVLRHSPPVELIKKGEVTL